MVTSERGVVGIWSEHCATKQVDQALFVVAGLTNSKLSYRWWVSLTHLFNPGFQASGSVHFPIKRGAWCIIQLLFCCTSPWNQCSVHMPPISNGTGCDNRGLWRIFFRKTVKSNTASASTAGGQCWQKMCKFIKNYLFYHSVHSHCFLFFFLP